MIRPESHERPVENLPDFSPFGVPAISVKSNIIKVSRDIVVLDTEAAGRFQTLNDVKVQILVASEQLLYP
jgi:hypothetical protein